MGEVKPERDLTEMGKDIADFISSIQDEVLSIKSDCDFLNAQIEDLGNGNAVLKEILLEYKNILETRNALVQQRDDLQKANYELSAAYNNSEDQVPPRQSSTDVSLNYAHYKR